MSEIDLLGIGAWSPRFANWEAFRTGIATGEWQDNAPLKPDALPPREHRRAPQTVKMAIEVMSQACRSAGRDPDGIATVFATAMGDMQITDYMCSALAQTPKLISPTRFHNSVHNAAPGYWSIATGSHSAANAVSAFDTTYSMAFLEGAIQAVEENTPVLVVTQEVAALDTLRDIWPTRYPFSAAFLLAPASGDGPRLCRAEFTVVREKVDWPPMPASLADAYASDFTANLLPLLADIASLQSNGGSIRTTFPISPATAMHLTLNAASRDLG